MHVIYIVKLVKCKYYFMTKDTTTTNFVDVVVIYIYIFIITRMTLSSQSSVRFFVTVLKLDLNSFFIPRKFKYSI